MDAKLYATTTTLLTFSKTLCRSTAVDRMCRSKLPLRRPRRITTTGNALIQRSSQKFGSGSPLFELRNTGAACVPSSTASFASSGDENSISGGGDDVSPSSSDVIVLHVRGMMCGGCESSVKRILENQSQVSSASVNHKTETATVWPVSEAKVTPNWQKVIGEELAKNLTNCGFDSNLRGETVTEG